MPNCYISTRTNLLLINIKWYIGKGWDKLMHGKIDSSDRRRPEHDTDEEDTDELDTEEEEEKNCLDMNIAYEDEVEVVECGDAGDNQSSML